MKIAVYPGSFDPFTLGHKDILLRSSRIFDKVIVAIGENHGKQNLFSIDERIKDISNEINDIGIKDNVLVESFSGLIVDFARSKDANILINDTWPTGMTATVSGNAVVITAGAGEVSGAIKIKEKLLA